MTVPAVVDLPLETPVEARVSRRLVGRISIADLVGFTVSCLIVVVAFSPILIGGRTLSGRAPGTNGYAPFPGQPTPDASDFRLDLGASAWALEPWAEVTHRAYSEGEIPLWNPYQAAGAPHAANMQSAVFDSLLLAVNLGRERPGLELGSLSLLVEARSISSSPAWSPYPVVGGGERGHQVAEIRVPLAVRCRSASRPAGSWSSRRDPAERMLGCARGRGPTCRPGPYAVASAEGF